MDKLHPLEALTPAIVAGIKAFIVSKKQETEGFSAEFPNQILRDDVLELLNKFCTVIYYPLTGESNNGFHITDFPQQNGKIRHFVFINTAQTIEKQVFTAAHELGHVWKADEHVLQSCQLTSTDRLRELIINRFAAELLLPEEIFKESYHLEFEKYAFDGNSIMLGDLFKVIAALMNQFCAPAKAIILRCYELKIMKKEIVDLLLGEGDIPKDELRAILKETLKECGYSRFQNPTNKKWITGLPELLDAAEESNTVSKAKIAHMREQFSLEKEAHYDKTMSIIS